MNKRNVSLLFLAFAALAALCFSVALTASRSTHLVTAESPWDVRVAGLTSNQRATNDFTFREGRVSGLSAVTALTIEDGQHGKRVVRVAGNSAGVRDVGESTRVLAITLEPRFGLLLPSVEFGLLPVSAAAFLLTLITAATWKRRDGSVNPAFALILLVCTAYLLAGNRFDYWPRAEWLWFAALLLVTGALVRCWISIRTENGNAAPSVPGSGFLSTINLCACAVFLVALYLRFRGLDFGLPALFHPDEGRKIRIARTMASTGDLNPHYFLHPTFLLYATAFLTWIKGVFTGAAQHVPEAAYLGRSVSAVLGSLSVLILYAAGKRLFDARAALLAALLLAVAPLHVVSSRYIKEDAAMVFFMLVSFYFAAAALTGGKFARNVLLAALFGGIASSSKYSGILSAAFVAGVFLNCAAARLIGRFPAALERFRGILFNMQANDPGPPRLFLLAALSAAVFVAGFLAVSPFAVLDFPQFYTDFMSEKSHMDRGHGVPITALSYFWMYHFKFSLLPAFTWFTAMLCIIACGYLLRRGRPADLFVLCAVLLFYLPAEYVNAKPPPQPERYIIPCIPFLALACGVFFSSLCDFLETRGARAGRIAAAAVALLAAALPLRYAWSHGGSIQNDTRIQARDWIFQNVPSGSTFLIDWRFYGPASLDKRFHVVDFKEKPGAKFLRGISVESLQASPYDYLVITNLFYGRYLNPLYRTHNLSKRFKKLFAEMTPLQVFSNPRFNYGFHNPEIYIFKIPKTPS